jgi:hypothetical protein
VWAKAIVVEDQMLEGNVGGEKCDEGCLGVEAECVIVQVDCM